MLRAGTNYQLSFEIPKPGTVNRITNANINIKYVQRRAGTEYHSGRVNTNTNKEQEAIIRRGKVNDMNETLWGGGRSSGTFDLLFYVIIVLKRSIDLR